MVKNLPSMQETRIGSLDQDNPWRRKWQPTPVFLPGKFHEQSSLVGYSPWGCKRVRYDLVTKYQSSFLACQPLEKYLAATGPAPNQPRDHHLLSRTIITSAAWSVSTQPRDQRLLSRAMCAWQTLEKYCQPLYQRLSVAWSSPINDFISTCQPID